MLTLGVLIPTRDEAQLITGCLSSVAGEAPVMVVDGGSSDATVALAQAHRSRPQVAVIPGGRDRQLDHGLRLLACTWVLIVPADARLRPGALARIRSACATLPGAAACLRLHPSATQPWHRLRARWSHLRSRWTQAAYVDQVPLLHRASALAAGSFRPCGAYDTADLARRMRRHGPFTVMNEPVVVSCRAYQRGFWATTLTHQRLRWRHWWAPEQ